jgi:hypothetical protein
LTLTKSFMATPCHIPIVNLRGPTMKHMFEDINKWKPWPTFLLYEPPRIGKSYLTKIVATKANSTMWYPWWRKWGLPPHQDWTFSANTGQPFLLSLIFSHC